MNEELHVPPLQLGGTLRVWVLFNLIGPKPAHSQRVGSRVSYIPIAFKLQTDGSHPNIIRGGSPISPVYRDL